MATIERTKEPAAPEAVEAFVERVLGDTAATMTTAFCVIGDRLGLFEALAHAPATSAALSERTGLDERYLREWAAGLAAAGYLTHEPVTDTFALPAAHAAALADDTSPAFIAGLHGMLGGLLAVLEPVIAAFRDGGGVALDRYDAAFWHGVERLTGVTFEHALIPEMIPAVPGLDDRLLDGADVADIGCGAGKAIITLAQAYPRARFHGFDIHGPSIERARTAADAAGVSDRVSFTELDVTGGIPGSYDVITIFDVVHDSREPEGLLRAARKALRPDGILTILEINCAETLEGNAGPVGAITYGFSLLHCMTQSLAAGGAGLGTCGLPEPRLRELCARAGFSSVTRVYEGPLDAYYDVRP